VHILGGTFFVYWKALDEWDFLGGNFIILKPKVGGVVEL